MQIINRDQEKFNVARRLNEFSLNQKPEHTLFVSIHGIRVKWAVYSRDLYHSLCSFFPANWIELKNNSYDLEVNWLAPDLLGHDSGLWVDSDPDCRFQSEGERTFVVQRDFIAVERNNSILITADYGLEDGFSNLLRWLLPRHLMKRNKVLLHSSAWKNSNDQVYICLGESGAGKTTSVSMVEPNYVLGDDMNLLEFRGDQWCVTPALVGQRIQARELIGQHFPIKSFCILEKSLDNQIEEVPKSRAFLALSSAFANLFWERMTSIEVLHAQTTIRSILMQQRFCNLKFNLNGDVWNYVEQT